MRIIREETLINQGDFAQSPELVRLRQHIEQAITDVTWPPGSTEFTIYPVKHANGVVPIRKLFQNNLKSLGWQVETRLDVGAVEKQPGPIDATYRVGNQHFAVEWETGNISSSHRALNKMVIGLLRGVLIGGALVLPTSLLYPYLTDRIGSFEELAPYFDVYRSVRCECGLLLVIAVEHDAISPAAPHIPKGTDGRALV